MGFASEPVLAYEDATLLPEFIRESNLIDPQYDGNGDVVSGAKPGDDMFDRQMAAWDVFCYYREQDRFPESIYLDAHREMTRGLELFERRGMSGCYRDCVVHIGGTPPLYADGEKTLEPGRVETVMRELLIPNLKRMIALAPEKPNMARSMMGWMHHCQFESIHPFWDGNGRIGRLGLLDTGIRLGVQFPYIVRYDKRESYYEMLQSYRNTFFDKWLTGESIKDTQT